MRLTFALLAAAIALGAAPGAAAGAALLSDGFVTGEPAQPRSAPSESDRARVLAATAVWDGSYSIYRAGSHSVQKTNYYCVPASIQMMLNIIDGRRDHSMASQTTYWRYAQKRSRYPIRDNGADPAGWVAALRHWGAGNYTVGTSPSRQGALRQAAKRMRLTGKPVGLLVWGRGGGHAWVMTGFKSTADPQFTNDYAVTSVQAMGPLWPDGTINGRSFDPGPREWVRMAELKRKFTTYRVRNSPAWNGRWVTVLP